MIYQDPSQANLSRFYEQELLPTLFERLDRVFPEFRWTRTACGWTGFRGHDNGPGGSAPLICHQNWGFVDPAGQTTSWLSYHQADIGPTGPQFEEAIRSLARRAGIANSSIPDKVSAAEQQRAMSHERRRSLLETYVGHCHTTLHEETDRHVRDTVARDWKINSDDLHHLPLGFFRSVQEIADHLVTAGFSRDEIFASHVVCDPRLEGRLIIPWRDRYGRVTTVAALEVKHQEVETNQVLFLRGGQKTEAFGLDVALRPGSGGQEHLVLVGSIVDVLYFQSLGACNVATIASHEHSVHRRQWEQLAAHGVRTVTLALGQQPPDCEKTLNSIRQARQAERAPRVFSLSDPKVDGSSGAVGFVQRHGLEQFRQELKKRVHGYRLLALDILDQFKTASGWTDQSLGDALAEAAEFDRSGGIGQQKVELERFFWPTILEVTGIHWDHLRRLMDSQYLSESSVDSPPPDWHDYELLMGELQRALGAGDSDCFKLLVTEAAQGFERQSPPDALPWSEASDVSETCQKPQDIETGPTRSVPESKELAVSRFRVSQTPTAAEIGDLAYSLWEKRGKPDGLDDHFWYEAESRLRVCNDFDAPAVA